MEKPQKAWHNKERSSQFPDFSASELNNYFSSVFTKSSIENFMMCTSDEEEGKFAFETVQDFEVNEGISCIKTNAIGEDGIPAILLKNYHLLLFPSSHI